MGRLLDIPIMDPLHFERAVEGDFRPNLRTYEATERAYRIMQDLQRTADGMFRMDVHRSPYAAIFVPYEHWRVLMMEMSPYMLRQTFGEEGTVPHFMGIRLVIEPAPRPY